MENFQKLAMKVASTLQLTHAQKSHLQNRLNQFYSHYKSPDHPPYSAIIERAIMELDQNGGSSEESISRFLEKEYKDLPWAHSMLLKHHLAKLCESSVITLTRAGTYVLAGTDFSINTTTKTKRKPVRKSKKSRRKKQLCENMNEQKSDEQLALIEKHPEPIVQEPLFIEGVKGQDSHSELSILEGPPPGFEFVKAGSLSHCGVKSLHDPCPQENTAIQVQEVTDERNFSERLQLQFGTLSSEVGDYDTLDINLKVYKRKRKVRGKDSISVEAVIYSEQAQKFSQALVVAEAEPKKRADRKRPRGHELLSKTLRRSPRLLNTLNRTVEEEKGLNLSIVEPQVDFEQAPIEEFSKLDQLPRPLRRSRRLADQSALISESGVRKFLNSNPSSDLRRPQEETGRDIVLNVMPLKHRKNQESEVVRADITYVRRRKKAKFQAVGCGAEKERKNPTSSVCQDVIGLSADGSQYELQPEFRIAESCQGDISENQMLWM